MKYVGMKMGPPAAALVVNMRTSVRDLKYCIGSKRRSKVVKRQNPCWIPKRASSTIDKQRSAMIVPVFHAKSDPPKDSPVTPQAEPAMIKKDPTKSSPANRSNLDLPGLGFTEGTMKR